MTLERGPYTGRCYLCGAPCGSWLCAEHAWAAEDLVPFELTALHRWWAERYTPDQVRELAEWLGPEMRKGTP